MMTLGCRCTEVAARQLRETMGLVGAEAFTGIEVEFRELPYFVVSRGRLKQNPETAQEITLPLLRLNERGLVFDSRLPGQEGEAVAFVPWQNVISLSITRAAGAKGSEPA